MKYNSEIFCSLVEGISAENTEIILCGQNRYSTYSQPNGKNMLVLRPLKHLVSLPLYTRRRIFSPQYLEQKRNRSTDTPLRLMLKHALAYVTLKYGEDTANRWRDQKYNQANTIIIADGVLSLFHGQYAFVDLIEKSQKSKFETTEELKFKFIGTPITIATRSLKFGESLGFFESWNIRDDFSELFQSLKRLYEFPQDAKKETWTDLFFWSDLPFETYPPSLVEKAVSDALSSFGPLKPNRGIIIMFVSTQERSNRVSERDLGQMDHLALQRAQGRMRLLWAPGFEELCPRSGTRLKSIDQLEASKFEADVEARFEELNLLNSRLFDQETEYLFHQGTQDSNEHSFAVLMSECWAGTWSDSLEIEGEYVML